MLIEDVRQIHLDVTATFVDACYFISKINSGCSINWIKISFFLRSEELLNSLRETLKSVKDIPHILKVIGVIDERRTKEKGYETMVKESFCVEEMTVDTFIPNDTTIVRDERINIISGPNYSGKSIYIKQVALVVFLAHIGSFVPANAATVGFTDRPVTSRSLCLLDEFGKGTLNEDGVGLLGEAINYFAMRDQPPKVLVCTHLTELLDESYLLKSENIKFYTMSVLRPEDASADIEDIVFLYRLVPGYTLLSYGLHCALLAGVLKEVIDRAALILRSPGNSQTIDRMHNERILAQDQQYKYTFCSRDSYAYLSRIG
ncbi:hypothetical protein CDL15_Pgr012039 [Punica granatum]|uniref:DNA mismatch repair proteins mutS family domain-containing protein n=1 Tax=Punica granatum TaxID=22663 RepID=A0A218XM90_PUNGR|nr:hypothetical protein CDL15_Pgr012039 [Punica granatum]